MENVTQVQTRSTRVTSTIPRLLNLESSASWLTMIMLRIQQLQQTVEPSKDTRQRLWRIRLTVAPVTCSWHGAALMSSAVHSVHLGGGLPGAVPLLTLALTGRSPPRPWQQSEASVSTNKEGESETRRRAVRQRADRITANGILR